MFLKHKDKKWWPWLIYIQNKNYIQLRRVCNPHNLVSYCINYAYAAYVAVTVMSFDLCAMILELCGCRVLFPSHQKQKWVTITHRYEQSHMHVPPSPSSFSKIWKMKVPPRVLAFGWIALHGGILTMDNLRHRKKNLVNGCPIGLADWPMRNLWIISF